MIERKNQRWHHKNLYLLETEKIMDNQESRDVVEELFKEQKKDAKKVKKIKNEHWSEHLLTLIAYEAQYIKAKQKITAIQKIQNYPEQTSQKRKYKKNTCNNFESGFLGVTSEKSEYFQVKELVLKYPILKWLYYEAIEVDFVALRQFFIKLLELKHSIIVQQFCFVYNLIAEQAIEVQSESIMEERHRFEWADKRKEQIVMTIQNNGKNFPWLSKYLSNDRIATQKLFFVESYCFIAERFNFSVNEFYKQAFSQTHEDRPSKKTKIA